MFPPSPVVPSPCFLPCTGAAGAAGTRPSLRPLIFGGSKVSQRSDAIAPREGGLMPLAAYPWHHFSNPSLKHRKAVVLVLPENAIGATAVQSHQKNHQSCAIR